MNSKHDDYLASHYVQRSNWLIAAVLGANDGILSTKPVNISNSDKLRTSFFELIKLPTLEMQM